MKTLLKTAPILNSDDKQIIAALLECLCSLNVKDACRLLERAQSEIGSKVDSISIKSLISS